MILLGRPFIYGLAVAGEHGVEHVLRNMINDIDVTMALSGVASMKEVNSSLIRRKK